MLPREPLLILFAIIILSIVLGGCAATMKNLEPNEEIYKRDYAPQGFGDQPS